MKGLIRYALLQLLPQNGILLIILKTSISIENITPSHKIDGSVVPLKFQPLPKDQLSKTKETKSVDSLSTMSNTEMDLFVQGSGETSTGKEHCWFLFII